MSSPSAATAAPPAPPTGAPPPPAPRPVADTVDTSGSDRVRSTPGLLRRRALLIVAIAVVAGVLGSWVVSDRLASTGRIDDEAEVITATRSIQADLARADAAAASAFLAGGVNPDLQSDQRTAYLNAMADVAADIEKAARLTTDGDPTHADIITMTEKVAAYSGLIETARTNNRQGFPIGSAYLNAASDLLSEEEGVYDLTDRVANAAAGRYLDEYNDQQSISLGLVGLALLAMVVLVVVLIATLRLLNVRFRRLINPAVGLATILAVALAVWMALGLIGHSSQLQDAREGGYGGIRAYVDARAAAFSAKGDEAKFLIARGDGAGFEARFGARNVQDAVLSARDGADSRLERDEGDSAIAKWEAYEALHADAVAADVRGDRAEALDIVLRGSTAEFQAFDISSENALNANLEQFKTDMRNARGSLRGLVFGPAIGAVLIALLSWFGIQKRIDEYR